MVVEGDAEGGARVRRGGKESKVRKGVQHSGQKEGKVLATQIVLRRRKGKLVGAITQNAWVWEGAS